jgi:hypothetical protein
MSGGQGINTCNTTAGMLYYERWMCELELESGQNPLFRFEGCFFPCLEIIPTGELTRQLFAGLLFGGF